MVKKIMAAELERLSAEYVSVCSGDAPDLAEIARRAAEIESILACLATM